MPTVLLLLLVLDHDLKPLFKVLLHAHAASFKQVLNTLDLSLQVLKLGVFNLIFLLLLIDALLDLILLFGAHKFTIVVHHTT